MVNATAEAPQFITGMMGSLSKWLFPIILIIIVLLIIQWWRSISKGGNSETIVLRRP